MCQFTTENFATNEMAHEVETFFKENFNPAERTIKQSVENIALNAKWLEKDGDKIRKFFAWKKKFLNFWNFLIKKLFLNETNITLTGFFYINYLSFNLFSFIYLFAYKNCKQIAINVNKIRF